LKFGVVVFPGSNCDHDTFYALKSVLRQPTVFLWHKDHDLRGVDCVVLPGGFSYGDYLRAGAIAKFSPLMNEVREFAGRGGLVLGICNGFQVLLELGLLPGAMLRNKDLKFLCEPVHLRVENTETRFSTKARHGQVLRIPIAHFDGNYYAPPEQIRDLERNHRVVFRYVDERGRATAAANVNGSTSNIAGIINREGNVLGMMPHPERASEALLGGEDGRLVFESLIRSGKPALLRRETP
jgi:phosphoribosylformylglycinamidine synthase subunit PurQ / glutaminase